MAESALLPTWLEELVNGVVVDISERDPGLMEREKIVVTPDSTPTQLADSNTASLVKMPATVHLPEHRLRVNKPRQVSGIRSETARRIEIAQLKVEVSKLEALVEYLTQKTIRRSGHLPPLVKSRLANAKLRVAVHRQRLWIAGGMSGIFQPLPQRSRRLLNYSICLPHDMSARVKTLCDLSHNVLRDGREILHERMQPLSSSLLPRHESSSYSTGEGDACASLFATISVEDITSVKDVLDALLDVMTLDQEFSCQKSGNCPATDIVESIPRFSQIRVAYQRCARLVANGAFNEFKGAMFSEYQTSKSNSQGDRNRSEQAMIIIHSVEDDKLHPFISERMRLDMTTITSIYHDRSHSANDSKMSKDTIIIAQSSFVRLRRCNLRIPKSKLRMEMDYIMLQVSAAVEAALKILILRKNTTRERLSSIGAIELPHQRIPLEGAGAWLSGDWEISTTRPGNSGPTAPQTVSTQLQG